VRLRQGISRGCGESELLFSTKFAKNISYDEDLKWKKCFAKEINF
jgi:hypothetical protein